jgi:hypothetical protein
LVRKDLIRMAIGISRKITRGKSEGKCMVMLIGRLRGSYERNKVQHKYS